MLVLTWQRLTEFIATPPREIIRLSTEAAALEPTKRPRRSFSSYQQHGSPRLPFELCACWLRLDSVAYQFEAILGWGGSSGPDPTFLSCGDGSGRRPGINEVCIQEQPAPLLSDATGHFSCGGGLVVEAVRRRVDDLKADMRRVCKLPVPTTHAR
jgi:hypothetical protein